MFCYHDKVEKKDIGGGIIFQPLGEGQNMNVFHWNMKDGSIIPLHHHIEEQFGFIIKGGLEATIGEERSVLKEGDAYFIPPNIPHAFIATCDTETIDAFNPKKSKLPGQ